VREFEPGDLDGLAALYADPAVLWWEPEPFTRERAAAVLARRLERYRSEGIAKYAVLLRDGGGVIGECGPVYRDVEHERLAEIGWALRSDHWGFGYATEAARAVVAHAAGLGLPRLVSLITPDNARSEGLARRLGMTVERRVAHAGLPHDLWVLDLGF
jgi:RimJ/RimL family protein N-acetyltransferase